MRSVWEAKSVIGVVDFDMGRLKCDRGRRFYRGPIQPQPAVVESSLRLRSVWEAKSVIGVVDFDMGRLKCIRGRRFYKPALSGGLLASISSVGPEML